MNRPRYARAIRGSWIGALLLSCLAAALPAHGAAEPAAAAAANDQSDKNDKSDRLTELERKLDQSLELIRQLSARVKELEAAQAARPEAAHVTPSPASPAPAAAAASASGAPTTPPDTAARLAQVEQTLSEVATGAAQRAEDTGMPMHGFADVGIGNHNAEFHEYQGADIGELDFFLTPRLGARTRALFELNFEVGESGQVGVDLERAQIGYQVGDSATLWLGRFHTPYGFYNTAFHHGQQIAISLRRPRFIEFEDHGGIMPAHTVGLWLTGAERLSDEKLTYDVYIGNSQGITGGELDMHNAGNLHGSTIFGGNLGLLLGGALDGLKVGLDAFQTRIEDEDLAPSVFTRVRSYGVYAAYDTDAWENIAEFHVFDDTDLTRNTGTHRSEAGFVQVAYRGRFTPYVRYERGSFQQADNYFAAQTYGASYYRDALGVRYDIDLQSALKFELADTHITDRDVGSFSDVLLQYAIRF
jgi:hypothetical protein